MFVETQIRHIKDVKIILTEEERIYLKSILKYYYNNAPVSENSQVSFAFNLMREL